MTFALALMVFVILAVLIIGERPIQRWKTYLERQHARREHPGRRLYQDMFWRGRTLTGEEHKLSHAYWQKYVAAPAECGDWLY